MGIVMTICMLIGIALLSPRWPSAIDPWRSTHRVLQALASVVLLAGMWNALWHGLRHLGAFWGLAALVSGLLMVATGMLVLHGLRAASGAPVSRPAGNGLRIALLLGLLGGFLLYGVTLVQLNLGYKIIGA